MNQILSTNNNYNNNYNKIDTKKIIIIFCICIILIGLIVLSTKTYEFIKKNTEKKNYPIPQIEIIRENEDAKEVSIRISATDGLNYIIYNWDDGKENRVNNLNGSSTFERIIEIPQNAVNNLKVQAESVNGVIGEKTEIFEMDIDADRPKIDSIAIVNSKLEIKASDESGIDYLIYQWEDEEEQKIEANENDNKTITTELEIKRGTYKLLLKVVDISGNEEKISKLITGVKEPEIKAIKYDDVVNVVVTHDMGFKRVEFVVNNELYLYDENYSGYDEDKKEINIDIPLKEGANRIQVKAYSLEKVSEEDSDALENYASKEFNGTCTYELQQ